MEAGRAEEREVLDSIYDGDKNFSKVEENLFQYRFEEFGYDKNFVIEIKWGDNYPEEAPAFNMDIFYNKHIGDKVKESIISGLAEQASDMLGMSMTYTLFEWVKDNSDTFLALQNQHIAQVKNSRTTSASEVSSQMGDLNINENSESNRVSKKKDSGLTKNQKRRMWDKQNAAGEKTRGHDWIDIIKHLSQTKCT